MNPLDNEFQQYPIGRFEKPNSISERDISGWADVIASFPSDLSNEVLSLTDEQLDTPYREGGWTVRQVVHHCADSHMNAIIRIKLALTEPKPTIKPYDEASWAELADGKLFPIASSLDILKGLHTRWCVLLKQLKKDELERTFIHPEHDKAMPVKEVIGMYAWHCRHHLAHITTLKKNRGWV